jgi:hypothetical protein
VGVSVDVDAETLSGQRRRRAPDDSALWE